MQNQYSNIAFRVLIAGVFVKLFVGVLYTWTIMRGAINAYDSATVWNWTAPQLGLPFTLATLFFALFTLIGGRIQDKFGPRWVATVGGAFVGSGLVVTGLIGDNPAGVAFSFGVMVGVGIGLAYSSVTPAALKWFHPSKRGLISGLTIGGFGLGSVVFAPAVQALFANFSIEQSMMIIGAMVLVVTIPMAQFVKNPPVGYTPAVPENLKSAPPKPAQREFNWKEMMATRQFYLMFIVFMFSASVGLWALGVAAQIAGYQAGATDVAWLVALMAVFNFAGRVIAGKLSDRIGRVNTLFLFLVIQLVVIAPFSLYTSVPLVAAGLLAIAFCFGTFLSVFPALTADTYGMKNYGLNYGIVYLAWGIAGLGAPFVGNFVFQIEESWAPMYIICAVMTGAMIVVNVFLKKVADKQKGVS